jgi:filamentous hemagglutinin
MIAVAAAAYFTGGALYGAYMGSAVSAAGGAMAITSAQFAAASFTASIVAGAGAGFVGGFIASGGNIKAALSGAVAGAVTGGVAGYYGSEYNISRIFTNSVAGGVQAKLQGRSFIEGLKSSLITSVFTYSNVLMRKSMIIDSLHPDAMGANDGTGFSNGMFGDFFKLAGGRFNPFADPDSPCSPLGCDQKGSGSIFGWGYSKGDFRDMVLESFAGPHDMANSKYFYDFNGNIRFSDLSPFLSNVREYVTNYTTSLVFATPFAAAAISEQTYYSSYRYIRR